MNSLIKNRLRVFYYQLLVCFQPRSTDPDISRQEFILNILLGAIIALLGIAFFFRIFFYPTDLETYSNNGLPLLVLFGALLFFISLYILSRKGFFRLASYFFLAIFFLLASYMGYRWGVDAHAVLLFFILIIVMSGILIGTKFAFITTTASVSAIFLGGYFQMNGIIHPNLFWKTQVLHFTDVFMFGFIFFVIATVSWLSNREIEKSLARARKSEAELKVERDSLEIKVEERTGELKEAQAEKMTQLYRFAEFGRLSSGLFHDLINPLNAVSLNIGQLKNQVAIGGRETAAPDISAQAVGCVDRAVSAAKRLEDMVIAVRKQLDRQENKTNFSLKEEIEDVISVLSHKAQKAGVTMQFLSNKDISLFGDAMKFNQVALNLIANAIDSYGTTGNFLDRDVAVSLKQIGNNVVLAVKDRGVGISEKDKQNIFEPFFTTKAEMGGIGIGLSMTKRITEKDFGGDIEVVTKEGEGSEFVARFPLKIAG